MGGLQIPEDHIQEELDQRYPQAASLFVTLHRGLSRCRSGSSRSRYEQRSLRGATPNNCLTKERYRLKSLRCCPERTRACRGPSVEALARRIGDGGPILRSDC